MISIRQSRCLVFPAAALLLFVDSVSAFPGKHGREEDEDPNQNNAPEKIQKVIGSKPTNSENSNSAPGNPENSNSALTNPESSGSAPINSAPSNSVDDTLCKNSGVTESDPTFDLNLVPD